DERVRFGNHGPRSAAVDEAQGVRVQGVQHQLGADECQDGGQAVVQVHQLVQQPVDNEEQLPQSHQGERVGREDQVDLLGEAEDRGDGVHGEEHVRAADGDHHDQHRGDVALAVLDHAQFVPDVPVGGAEDPAGQAQQRVLLELLVVAAAHLGVGGVDQEGTEDVEDPGEV